MSESTNSAHVRATPRVIVKTRSHAPPGAEIIAEMPTLVSDEARQVFAYGAACDALFLISTSRVEEAAAYLRQVLTALDAIERPDDLPHVSVSTTRLRASEG